MARKLRCEVEGGLYHIITRGNNRQAMFHGPQDHQRFLSLLGVLKEKVPFFLYQKIRPILAISGRPYSQPSPIRSRTRNRRSRCFPFTVTAELGAFVMFYVSKDKVLEFIERADEDVWIYGCIGVFLVGFFTVFTLCGLLPIRFRRPLGRLDIWLLSAGAGIANIGLFFLLINFQTR